jgi:hypothetical protein
MRGTNIVGIVGTVWCAVVWSGRPRPLPLTLTLGLTGLDRAAVVLKDLVIPKPAAGGREPAPSEAEGNLLFACSATTHVETAASAVQGAERRPSANKGWSRDRARRAANSSPEGPAYDSPEPAEGKQVRASAVKLEPSPGGTPPSTDHVGTAALGPRTPTEPTSGLESLTRGLGTLCGDRIRRSPLSL